MINNMLHSGQVLVAHTSGLPCIVEEYLGEGSQGEVYRVKVDARDLALKWYFRNTATKVQRNVLTILTEKGPPDPRFLWPLDLVYSTQQAGFGYLMNLRPHRYCSVVDLMKRKVSPSFYTLITTGLELASAFLALHSRGMCYRDISFGNVFFDPDSGEVLICDNDNVGVEGIQDTAILGTPRFMAPEIVRGEAQPGTQSDLFSLAVLIFYLLMVHHPLEGKKELDIHCFDLPAMVKLYGREAVFIFDPKDDSNRPLRGYHDNALIFWPLYPKYIRNLFIKAFTSGIQDISQRVRESEWRVALVNLRDGIILCKHCGAENFLDEEPSGQDRTCWSCKSWLGQMFLLETINGVVVLNYETKLYPHHLDISRLYCFDHPVAQVSSHPHFKDKWGLTNLSGKIWIVDIPGGERKEVPHGRSVGLVDGILIHFGTSDGKVNVIS